jgi:hypothetical protein
MHQNRAREPFGVLQGPFDCGNVVTIDRPDVLQAQIENMRCGARTSFNRS